MALDLCASHYRRQSRARAQGKDPEAAVRTPLKAVAGEPQVKVTLKLHGATHRRLLAMAEAQGTTVHALLLAEAESLAAEP